MAPPALLLALGLSVPAQDADEVEDPPCCAHEVAAALAPLSADAGARERRLRSIHDGIDAVQHFALGRGMLDHFEAQLEAARAEGQPRHVVAAQLWYGSYLLFHGRVDEAISELEECAARVEARPEDYRPTTRVEVLHRLAVAWFRLGERRNCIARHNQDSCIFPLRDGAIHVEPRGAARSIEVLERVLALDPDHHESRWLLTIAYQALGTPEDVPARHRFPAERQRSEAPFPRLRDVARALDVARRGRAGSVVTDDLTGDGLLDVLTCSFDTGAPLTLFAGRAEGGFEDVTAAAGLGGQLGGANLVQGDVDGDGLLDVLVLRGAGFFTLGEWPCSLLRQVAPGRFEDVTAAAGLDVDGPTGSAVFADLDVDGDLDLAVGYQSMRAGDAVRHPSRVYRNDGSGVFADVTEESGVRTDGHCTAVVAGDLDGDGWPDLYFSNHFGPNQLWRNRGDGTFEDVTRAAGVGDPITSRAAFVFDPDNDGDLDLFVSHHGHADATSSVARWYWDGGIEGDTQRLYRGDGRGGFEDATAAFGLRRTAFALGATTGDVDGDGRPDVHLSTGAEDLAALWPNLLLWNDGARFRDVTEAAGVGHLQKGAGAAFADLDDDGDQDVFLVVGGLHLDDGFGNVLFENPGFGHRWLALELVGVESNRFGVGARVRARIREGDALRDVYDHGWPASSYGGAPLRRELGLGEATEIVELEVRWPGPEGTVQRFTDVPLDAHLIVTEGRPDYAHCEREPRPLR